VAATSPAVQPIITPEAVVLDFERAGAPSRVIAVSIDGLALALTLALLLWASITVLGETIEGAGAALLATFTSLGMVIVWFCAFETLWRGRTPGKAVMGLRVISADGTSVRFQQAFLRAAMTLVDFFLIPVGFIAVVAVLLSPRDQRLGDMAAGTLVVRERSASTFVAPVWFAPPRGWEGYARSLDVAALDDQTYGLVRSYLLRVFELNGGARDHLAVRIGNPVAVQIGHQPPPYVHPHLFLTCVAAAWQLAHGGVGPGSASLAAAGAGQLQAPGTWPGAAAAGAPTWSGAAPAPMYAPQPEAPGPAPSPYAQLQAQPPQWPAPVPASPPAQWPSPAQAPQAAPPPAPDPRPASPPQPPVSHPAPVDAPPGPPDPATASVPAPGPTPQDAPPEG
jgi:uncharacterized RDD family membrane protein YckC